jgi:hypothetical protein
MRNQLDLSIMPDRDDARHPARVRILARSRRVCHLRPPEKIAALWTELVPRQPGGPECWCWFTPSVVALGFHREERWTRPFILATSGARLCESRRRFTANHPERRPDAQ